jgi:hypothetical protein
VGPRSVMDTVVKRKIPYTMSFINCALYWIPLYDIKEDKMGGTCSSKEEMRKDTHS